MTEASLGQRIKVATPGLEDRSELAGLLPVRHGGFVGTYWRRDGHEFVLCSATGSTARRGSGRQLGCRPKVSLAGRPEVRWMTGRQDRQCVDNPLPSHRGDGEELLPFTDDRTHRSET